MMEPIRLWKWEHRVGAPGEVTWHRLPIPGMPEYAALPRADFDALVKRADRPLDHAMRTSCGHEWTVRHTACPTCFDSVKREREAATARAERMAALLEDVVHGGWFTRDPRMQAEREAEIIARIDAELNAPTPDDRRGVDDEAMRASGGQA